MAPGIDNRREEVFGGHARFKAANGKIGFLDRERRIVIPARYDAAYPSIGAGRWFASDVTLCAG
jgi:hypothetical protein